MPRLNRGAVGALAEYAQERRKAADARYEQDQDFQNRVAAAGISSGRLEPIIQGGRVVGVQPTQVAPFDAASLKTGQSYSQRIGGGTLITRGPAAPSSSSLPESQAQAFLSEARPGTPLPSTRPVYSNWGDVTRQVPNIPVTPSGVQTINRAILQGHTESPAAVPSAQATPAQFPLHAAAGRFGAPAKAAPSSTAALLSDAIAARAEGFSREEVQAQLHKLGVAKSTADSLLKQAGF